MELYQKLSKVSFLQNNYAFKFLFIAFVGIHIPLIGILFYTLYSEPSASSLSIIIFALVMTLAATAITLFLLKKLIMPIELASNSLIDYKKNRIVPLLPIEYKDEAGLLMRNILEMVQDNEKFINEKQDLMYLLSHDLRTFTGNSQSLSKLIIDANPSENIKEYAELIYQSTTQQLHFIQSFIKMLKVQDEILSSVPKLQTISLEAVNAKVSEQVMQQLKIKNIKLTATIEVKEQSLTIDPELLIRVLVNLVDNAIKFSFPDNEINLRYYESNDRFMIAVKDNGLGFDIKQPDLLFEKFTKEKKLGTANEFSTGLGLYLCKTIAGKYQGKLNAKSDGPNKGATFTLSF